MSSIHLIKVWACYECENYCILLNFKEPRNCGCPSAINSSSNWFEYESPDMLISELMERVDLADLDQVRAQSSS